MSWWPFKSHWSKWTLRKTYIVKVEQFDRFLGSTLGFIYKEKAQYVRTNSKTGLAEYKTIDVGLTSEHKFNLMKEQELKNEYNRNQQGS